jgi:hypothetical protein
MLTRMPHLLVFIATSASAEPDESLAARYRETAARLIGAALTDDEGWEKLSHLTLRIGHRLSGSPALERAVAWTAERMKAEGLDNVRLQPVTVPHWVRGREELRLLTPEERPLAMLGLGGSAGTSLEGVTASVVAVRSFEELDGLGREKVAGKIVLYDPPWEGYGKTVQYRSTGPSRAARMGAAALLLRSVTPRSLYTPHTGSLRYEDGVPKIPAAAITVEDAYRIRRLVEAGDDVRVHMIMEAHFASDGESANVIGEIRGYERPEEVVVVGGHLDSWDVGQGAHDDGVGTMAAWQAVTLVKRLGLRPRRTLRVVLWTNEENGLRGGLAYRDALGNQVSQHVAAIEMDGGAEKPLGFGFGLGGIDPHAGDPAYEKALGRLQDIARLLDGIGAGAIARGGGGADIGPLMREGVPGLGLQTVGEHYFDWHHTQADTLDKVDPQDFRRCIATLAVMGYVLAEMPERLVTPRE